MKVSRFIVNVTSEDPDRLAAFYRDVVELTPDPEMGGRAFDILPNTTLAFDGHSDTAGPTKEPQRVLIDLFVDDIAAEEARLKSKGVTFIREQGKEEWGGLISTFLDPDGNYVQLVHYQPS